MASIWSTNKVIRKQIVVDGYFGLDEHNNPVFTHIPDSKVWNYTIDTILRKEFDIIPFSERTCGKQLRITIEEVGY
jgi:hypothetical protein